MRLPILDLSDVASRLFEGAIERPPAIVFGEDEQPIVVTLFAGRLSLIAFATSSLRSLMAGEQFGGALQAALAAAALFYVVGLICGEVARRLAEESARADVERMIIERTEIES